MEKKGREMKRSRLKEKERKGGDDCSKAHKNQQNIAI